MFVQEGLQHGGAALRTLHHRRCQRAPPSAHITICFIYIKLIIMRKFVKKNTEKSSVADPDPPDPRVFGPSGSGSISQRYGSGSDFGSGS
jgi:hypothetical protein